MAYFPELVHYATEKVGLHNGHYSTQMYSIMETLLHQFCIQLVPPLFVFKCTARAGKKIGKITICNEISQVKLQ